jgi:hypothetical protein
MSLNRLMNYFKSRFMTTVEGVNDAALANRNYFDIDFALSDRDSHSLHAQKGPGLSYPKCLPEMKNRVGFKSDVAFR